MKKSDSFGSLGRFCRDSHGGGFKDFCPCASVRRGGECIASRSRGRGGKPIVNYRSLFGHHPHGLDPNKTAQIVNFFLAP